MGPRRVRYAEQNSAARGSEINDTHERGHARAYLTLVKPEFESEMKNFVLSNMGVISKDEAEKIRRIHDRINNRHVKESGQYANDAESSWYMGNGFNRKQVGEYYEYSK